MHACAHILWWNEETDWYSRLSFYFSLSFSVLLYPAYQQCGSTRPVKEIFIVEHEHLSSGTHTHVKSSFLAAIVTMRRHKRSREVMEMVVFVFFVVFFLLLVLVHLTTCMRASSLLNNRSKAKISIIISHVLLHIHRRWSLSSSSLFISFFFFLFALSC
jgi:hypothetical protein